MRSLSLKKSLSSAAGKLAEGKKSFPAVAESLRK
jgi:hypothetical protein